MRLGYRCKLNPYEARALYENPEEYRQVVERKMKAGVVDAAKQFVEIKEIKDPERPKPTLEELTKPTEYSAFPQYQSDLYPEYDATLHVYSESRFKQIVETFKALVTSTDENFRQIHAAALYKLLNS